MAPAILRAIPSHEIAKAAVFDFLFCAGDRHTQNVYVSDSASIKLADNDNLLGKQVFKLESKLAVACGGELAVPARHHGELASAAGKYCGGALETLDYRCHVGPSGEPALPEKLRRCLRTLTDDDAEATRSTFGIERVYAETLKKRAGDLLSEGLPEALRRAGLAEKAISDAAAGERPVGKAVGGAGRGRQGQDDGVARQHVAPHRAGGVSRAGSQLGGRAARLGRDARFEGGNATCDETGAQIQGTTERK